MCETRFENEWAIKRDIVDDASRASYLSRVAEGKVVEVGGYERMQSRAG